MTHRFSDDVMHTKGKGGGMVQRVEDVMRKVQNVIRYAKNVLKKMSKRR